MTEEPESEKDMFERIVGDLRKGRPMDDLSPDESACFSDRARELESSESSGKFQEPWDKESPVQALKSQDDFVKFLETNIEEFGRGMSVKSRFMLMVLARELKSHRPAARIQAARMIGELLGIFKRGKDGSIRPDSGNTGDGNVDRLEAFLARSSD